MSLRDITIHSSHGKQRASLPAKPQVKDGQLVKDAAGKIQYVLVIDFADRQTRDAFGQAVITRRSTARSASLSTRATRSKPEMARKRLDDSDIPF